MKIGLLEKSLLVAFSCLLAAFTTPAATLCVRPSATGNGTGVDWNNALGASFTPVRGNTYYLSDGSYGRKTFSSANSGTTLITIKKATASDHFTDIGWTAADGGGQAVFRNCQILTDYWLFDGQTRDSNWRSGAVSQYGIKFQGGGSQTIRLDNGGSSGANNVTFRYCDLEGGGRDTGAGDDVVYGLYGPKYITFQHCALHDSDRTIFLTRGTPTDWLVEYCYIARNASSATVHGEIMSSTDSARIIFRHNVIEDPEGTAVWAFLNNGKATDWAIYGNVIFHSPAYNREGISGSVFVANDASNNNTMNGLRYYNNTHWGVKGVWSGVVIQSGSDNVVENNIWSQCTTPNNSGGTYNYNTYYLSTTRIDSGANSQAVSTQPLKNPGNGNFTLTAASPAGRILSAPYNVDPNGVTRGSDGMWDRGAFEYGSINANPAISTSPTSLDFGSIPPNSTKDLVVTIRNTDGGTLEGIASVSVPFSIVSDSAYRLSANQSQAITVRFSPIVTGRIDRTVAFTGGGGAIVAVTGTGVTPPAPPNGLKLVAQ